MTTSAPYVYRTAAGTLEVFYRAQPAARTGTLSVTVKEADGAQLLAREYAIRWG